MTKKHDPGRIGNTLKRMAAAVAAGRTVAEASRDCGISLATYYQWRRKYDGLTSEQLRDYFDKVKHIERLEKQIVELSLDKRVLQAVLAELLVDSKQKRQAVQQAQQVLGVSERRACAALSLPRSSHRYSPSRSQKNDGLIETLRQARRAHPQYGYRRLAALLRATGWQVSDIRVYRLLCRPELRSSK